MSTQFNVFIPPTVLALEAQQILMGNIIMPRLVNKKYEPKSGAFGSTVRLTIPRLPTTVETFSRGSTLTYTRSEVDSVDITVDKIAYKKIPFYADELSMAVYDPDEFIDKILRPNVLKVAEQIEAELLALYKDIYYSIGTAGDAPDSKADLAAIRAAFKRWKIPKPWYFVQGNTAWEAFTQIEEILRMDAFGSRSTITTGEPDTTVYGFFPVESDYLDTYALHTIGGWYDASTPLVDQSGHAIGDTEIHVDGLGASVTGEVADGDLFLAADESHTSVATAAANSDSNGDVDITYAPAASAAWEDGDSITVTKPASGQTYINNLAFNPAALAFVARPIATRPERGGADVGYADQDGIPIRVVLGWDHEIEAEYMLIEVMYGVACPRPDMAIRVLG